VTPGSIMPRYPHLFTDQLDFDSIPVRLKAMKMLGVPYSEKDRETSVDNAKAQAAQIAQTIAQQGGPQNLQDKQAVALIAYIQRLGIDLFAAPPSDTPEPAPTTQPSNVASASANP